MILGRYVKFSTAEMKMIEEDALSIIHGQHRHYGRKDFPTSREYEYFLLSVWVVYEWLRSHNESLPSYNIIYADEKCERWSLKEK